MARGPMTGATAVLVAEVAKRGVAVSRYQIERWRTAGLLPTPTRKGLGRGRGVSSRAPDEDTIARATTLARVSRRGSRLPGGHIIERFAAGIAVPEGKVRAAFRRELDLFAKKLGATEQNDDVRWLAMDALAAQAAREPMSHGWQDLIDAIEGKEVPSDLPPSRKRALAGGMIQLIGGGEEPPAEDLVELVSFAAGLNEEQRKELHRERIQSELAGITLFDGLVGAFDVATLSRLIETVDIDTLRRSASIVNDVATFQTMIVLISLLDFAGEDTEFLGPLRKYDASMVRRLQRHPMWVQASALRLMIRPRQRIRTLVIQTLMLIIAGQLDAWQDYRDLLMALVAGDDSRPTEPFGVYHGSWAVPLA